MRERLVTRREVLNRFALSAGAGALPSMLTLAARAQDDTEALTRQIHADLVTHAGFGDKFSGGPGDLATADWIAQRLGDLGYALEVSEFKAPFFVKRAARLSARDAVADVLPQAPVVPTGRDGVTAPLALVATAGERANEVGAGAGSDIGDVHGRIALIVAPFGRHAALFADRGIGETVHAAAAAGAVAIVVVTTGPSGEAIALNAPEEPFVPIPMAVIAPKRAAPFVEAAARGEAAALVLDGDAIHRPSRNIVARMERAGRWIAMSTPRSGWFGCVAERGTGTAAFLELADWIPRRFPEHSVFLMNTGGHEYFFAGSHRVLHEAPPPNATDVWVHIGATLAARGSQERNGELAMLDTADPGRTLMATKAARAGAREAFRGLSGLAEPVDVRPNAGELSTFTDLGYEKAFAVLGLHTWFHTVEDTLERVDASLIVPVLRAHRRTLEILVGGVALV